MGAFEISIRRQFSASHQLYLNDGVLEPLHGHNWRVKITVGAPSLDSIGTVMDFHELERLADAIIAPMHNRHLNELPAFAQTNPSAENVALLVAQRLALPKNVRLISVEIWETDDCSAIYRP
jgi:6-pyruvoyltetrahydropterin/6-carboxytetrahydropterin synthase